MATGTYRTNNASGNELKEDVLDIITDISPKETPIMSGLGTSTATQSTHQFLKDSVARSTSINAIKEGFDTTYSDLTSPARDTNYVQEVERAVRVSQKQMDSSNYGMSDPYAYQKAKQMSGWKMDAEFSLIFGSGIAGDSGVAWTMKGLRKAITTNFVSYASGTTLTETRFNDILELAYDDVDDSPWDVYTTIKLKRAISAFTAGVTKNVDMDDKRLVNSIDVYESDVFSMIKLFAHKDINSTTAPQGLLIAIQPRAFKVAYLHRPEHEVRPSNGAYESGAIYGSLTLEFRQEKAGIQAHNLILS